MLWTPEVGHEVPPASTPSRERIEFPTIWRQPTPSRIERPKVWRADPALVGSAGTVATSSGTTVSPSFAQSTTAGNLIVLIVVANLCSTGSLVASPPSGYTQAVSRAANAGNPSTAGGCVVHYKANCGAGETAPSVSAVGSPTYMAAQLLEFSGCVTSSPVDKSGSNGNSTGSFGTAVVCSATDAGQPDLVVMIEYFGASKNCTNTVSFSDFHGNLSGLTAIGNDSATKQGQHFAAAFAITTNNGSTDGIGFTNTLSTGVVSNSAGVIVSFQGVAATPNEMATVAPQVVSAARIRASSW